MNETRNIKARIAGRLEEKLTSRVSRENMIDISKLKKFLITENEKAREQQLTVFSTSSDNMRKDLILTDVILVCGGEELPSHRLVLAASSPFFYAMFTSYMRETFGDRVDLQNIDPNTMKKLLEFMYTGNINVENGELNEIKALLSAADQLQIGIVFNYCCSLLLATLAYKHFLEIWEIASGYNNNYMKSKIVTFIAENFAQTSRASEFLHLPQEVITAVVTRDDIKNHSADLIINAVFNWVKHNKEQRISDLKVLLSYIDFNELSNEYLMHIVEKETLMNESMELLKLTMSAISSRYLNNLKPSTSSTSIEEIPISKSKTDISFSPSAEKLSVTKSLLSSSRTETYFEEQKFLILRIRNSSDELYWRWFYPETGKVSVIMRSKIPLLLESAICPYQGIIYFLGGKTRSMKISDSAFTFNASKFLENRITPLINCRYGAGAVGLGEYVYVAGGMDKKRTNLKSVERLDIIGGWWEAVTPMNKRRKYPGLLSYGEDKIYVMSSTDDSAESSLECYDASIGQWSDVMASEFSGMRFKKGNCFLVERESIFYILIQSYSRNILHLYTVNKDSRMCEHKLFKDKLPNILSFAVVEIADMLAFILIDASGNVVKLNDEKSSWMTIESPLPFPSYAVFL